VWAVAKGEARRGGEDGSSRARRRPRGFRRLANALCLFMAINVLQGEFCMQMRIIYDRGGVAAEVGFVASSAQYASSCVALHLPTRQNNTKAHSSSCVITRDHELAASCDADRLDGSVSPCGAGAEI
jgi:hypothetical protein